ncbi:MAG TPA: hypothetical protein PLX89_05390 [Verrucomicrobiota bacterium]|nr:hypothetical protein [Verrucomicrobiales bacterium]HRI12420.1 hypothetical protein [Verrucomicrobiota bacterium]
MDRVVQPELLDTLSPDDKDALRSRRDLRRINRIMGHYRRWPKLLESLLPLDRRTPWRVVELGAGDAVLSAEVWRRLPGPPPGSQLFLVDQHHVVADQSIAALTGLGWSVELHTSEALDWLKHLTGPEVTLIYANLFVHHFDPVRLAELLGQVAQRTKAFGCLEPRRCRRGLLGVGCLRLFVCNAVTQHDARRSVWAGFRDCEIGATWPSSGEWALNESPVGLFSHQFSAARRVPR